MISKYISFSIYLLIFFFFLCISYLSNHLLNFIISSRKDCFFFVTIFIKFHYIKAGWVYIPHQLESVAGNDLKFLRISNNSIFNQFLNRIHKKVLFFFLSHCLCLCLFIFFFLCV